MFKKTLMQRRQILAERMRKARQKPRHATRITYPTVCDADYYPLPGGRK